MTARNLAVVAVVLFTGLLAFAAFTAQSRPAASDWESAWESAVATLPTPEELGTPPDRSLCSHALGELRFNRPLLIPTPDPALDATVNEWLRVAEDAMFECPPTSGDLPSLVSAYDELARLEAGIDVVLDIDLGVE